MVQLVLEPVKQNNMIRSFYIYFILVVVMLTSCKKGKNKEEYKDEIYAAEKAFERMTSERGIAEAFYFYADQDAVIKREGDSLVVGKENIKIYYERQNLKNAVVKWSPDFIDVAESGDMAYTYGKYTWSFGNNGDTTRYKGVFHTVWKRQQDGSWKYVWD